MHCPDRSVPKPVTDSGDDRPILGHGNGFAKLRAHDGAGGSREGAATTVVTIDRWREMRVASERVTPGMRTGGTVTDAPDPHLCVTGPAASEASRSVGLENFAATLEASWPQ